MVYDNNKGGEYGNFIIQELREPVGLMTPEFRAVYEKFSKRILWMDGNACPGAFQMNTAWYHSVPERDPIFAEHEHGYGELIGFFGSNPGDPYDLGGIIEFSINKEAHKLTRTSLIFVPGGVAHNPLRILEVTRPIFHFSVVANHEYAEAKDVYK
ncbi:MAG: hypothetical protein FWG32_00585 [Oscillospiraceae bacterium]|nr:hypothetical protein [Oscillospiraceae bacterium]